MKTISVNNDYREVVFEYTTKTARSSRYYSESGLTLREYKPNSMVTLQCATVIPM